MAFFGTSGPDNLVGTEDDDIFNMGQGGRDVVAGLEGNDTFRFGATFRANDQIHGDDGNDVLRLDGDYSGGVHFAATTMDSVETIGLATGHTYKLVMNDGNVAGAAALTINASQLALADRLIFDGTHEVNGGFLVIGGAGNDRIDGGAGDDDFDLSHGGADVAAGGGGNDDFHLGSALDRNDRIDGGIGPFNNLLLDGDYSVGVRFEADTIANIAFIDLAAGHSYKLVFHDGNLAAGEDLLVTAHQGAGETVVLDASSETDGRARFTGGAGTDIFTGGAGEDTFDLSAGGDDIARGGLANDKFNYFLHSFTKADSVNGGSGSDVLTISGDYSAGLKLKAAQLVNVEVVILAPGFDYKLSTADDVVAAGQTTIISAPTLAAGQTVKFNGSAELDGKFILGGGAGSDTLTGGHVDDSITGGLGADVLAGGDGFDVFFYGTTAADSTGLHHDAITAFDGIADSFSVFNTVTAVDAEIAAGHLGKATFDADLATAVSALAAHHGVLFTPDNGFFAGHTFLIVNTDDVVGYHAGADLVIEMIGMLNKAAFDAGNF